MKQILILALAFLLPACSTFEGMKQDVTHMGQSIQSGVDKLAKSGDTESQQEEDGTPVALAPIDHAPQGLSMDLPPHGGADQALMADGGCLPVLIDPRLQSVTEFYDSKAPSVDSVVSAFRVSRVTVTCPQDQSDDAMVAADITFRFDGELGPKARRKTGDRPSFSYPYFISVTDQAGNELTREIFAASLSYGKDQDTMSLEETIRQKLPRAPDGSLPYRIQAGFQLTEDQLFYNASL